MKRYDIDTIKALLQPFLKDSKTKEIAQQAGDYIAMASKPSLIAAEIKTKALTEFKQWRLDMVKSHPLFASILYQAALAFIATQPFNDEDVVTQEPIDPANRVILSSGHQSDPAALYDWLKKSQVNPYNNQPFDEEDVKHIMALQVESRWESFNAHYPLLSDCLSSAITHFSHVAPNYDIKHQLHQQLLILENFIQPWQAIIQTPPTALEALLVARRVVETLVAVHVTALSLTASFPTFNAHLHAKALTSLVLLVAIPVAIHDFQTTRVNAINIEMRVIQFKTQLHAALNATNLATALKTLMRPWQQIIDQAGLSPLETVFITFLMAAKALYQTHLIKTVTLLAVKNMWQDNPPPLLKLLVALNALTRILPLAERVLHGYVRLRPQFLAEINKGLKAITTIYHIVTTSPEPQTDAFTPTKNSLAMVIYQQPPTMTLSIPIRALVTLDQQLTDKNKTREGYGPLAMVVYQPLATYKIAL